MDLQTYLTERGLTDAAFAAMVGLDRSVINRLKARKLRPSMASAQRIFDATKGAVTPNDFLENRAVTIEQAIICKQKEQVT